MEKSEFDDVYPSGAAAPHRVGLCTSIVFTLTADAPRSPLIAVPDGNSGETPRFPVR
jgi:hypothetical protein